MSHVCAAHWRCRVLAVLSAEKKALEDVFDGYDRVNVVDGVCSDGGDEVITVALVAESLKRYGKSARY